MAWRPICTRCSYRRRGRVPGDRDLARAGDFLVAGLAAADLAAVGAERFRGSYQLSAISEIVVSSQFSVLSNGYRVLGCLDCRSRFRPFALAAWLGLPELLNYLGRFPV